MSDFAQLDRADELHNELYDVCVDVENVLDTMSDQVERQIEWRITDLSNMLNQHEYEKTAENVNASAIRAREILRKALFDVQMELDDMRTEASKAIDAESWEKA